MTEKILRLPEVKDRVGLSRSSIYQAIQRKEFPSSIPLGARAVGWLESDVAEWLTSRIAQRKGSQ
jgi:prophage regulatory protein